MLSLKLLKLKTIWLLVCFALGNLLAGCSAVGFTAGAILDEATNNKAQVEPWRVGSLKYGKDVTVFLRDSTLVSGNYHGLYDVDRRSYSRKYLNAVSDTTSNIYLPAINDTIDVVLDKNIYRDNCFLGFGYTYRKSLKINNIDKIANRFYISSDSNSTLPENRFYLNNVTEIITDNGKATRGHTLSLLIENGKIPITAGVRIVTMSNIEQIPLEDIDHLEYRKKNAKWVFFGLGLAVDVVMVIALLSIDPLEGMQINIVE